MNRGAVWLLALLGLGIVASGIGGVYVKYLSRIHFSELQDLRAERDRLDIHWVRLQLEESTRTTYARVEEAARARLMMRIPKRSEIVVLGAE